MNFSEKLYFVRKRSALSQEELAAQLDVSRQAISKWESGTAIPESEKLIAISEFFGISLDDLLKDDRSIDDFKGKKDEKAHAPDRGKFFFALILSAFCAISSLAFGIWMICSPTISQELAASSVITLDGRAIVLLLSVLFLFLGVLLLLKTRRR